jgi:hypothetical protein
MKARAPQAVGRVAITMMATMMTIAYGCELPRNGIAPRSSFASSTLQSSELQEVKVLLHELSKPIGAPVQPAAGEFAQSLVALYARIGAPETAFSIAREIQSVQGRMQSYLKIGETCAAIQDKKCIDAALRHIDGDDLARKLTDPYMGSFAKRFRISALTVIAMTQIKIGDLAHAKETFSGIDLTIMHPELADQSQRGFLKELAIAYVQRRDVKSALNTIERIQRASSRDHALADVAIALADIEESQGTKQAVELLRKNNPGIHLAPRIVEALVKVGDKDEAARFLQPLLQSALESRNEWAIGDSVVALAFLDPTRARQAAPNSPEKPGARGSVRRDSTFASIAAIQAKGNDIRGALETIELVQNMQTHDKTLEIMAEDLTKRHDIQHALEVARAIKHPTWKYVLAKVQALMGDVPGAMRLATSLPNSHDKSQAFSAIVDAQVSVNALEDAVQTAGLIDHDNIKDRTYTELARSHAKAGQLSIAITLVDQVMYQRRGEVMRQLGLIYASTGRWTNAWNTPQESRNLASKDLALHNSLMLGFVQGMLDYRAMPRNTDTITKS